MNKLKVSLIRCKNLSITKEPIIYYWWFNENCLNILLMKLNGVYSLERIKTKQIQNKKYALLYIGKSKNGNDRLIKYHIIDTSNFHLKGVVNGRLSSLRATLCGLLELPMSESRMKINDFMDENCIVEWEEQTLDQLDEFEKNEISLNYLPLNYQNTKGILSKEHRKILRDSKRQMKK